MKSSRFKEAQIIKILRDAESGKKVVDVCRQYGISDATFYTWRKKYAGMTVADLTRLRELQAENSRLKRIVAQQALDIDCLKEINSKKW